MRNSGKLISAADNDPVLSTILSQFIQQQFTKHGDVVLPTYCNLPISYCITLFYFCGGEASCEFQDALGSSGFTDYKQ